MRHFLFAFKYLSLRDPRGHLVAWRDVIPVLVLSIVIVVPFELLPGSTFFGSGGFVDKAANLTACLTGFYIAGLLAVATFAAESSALDNPIRVGPAYWNTADFKNKLAMSRREYVCSIFGYLAFLSLMISLISGSVSGLVPGIAKMMHGVTWHIGTYSFRTFFWFSIIGKVTYAMPVSHLVITSGYGLYYLIYKIYGKEPKLIEVEREGPSITPM